jgi:thiol-disulfide isomerase/thioredoxin
MTKASPVVLGLVALVLVAGCTGTPASNGSVSAASVSSAPPAPSGPPCLAGEPIAGSAAAAAGTAVPALRLRCFDGTGEAALTDLRAPAIVNLWASWCSPCRAELPVIQSFAERSQGKVRVVGVVTRDRRDAAQSFIDDKKLTFPMLDDPQQRLLTAIGRNNLPVTLFVTADGRIAHVYNSTALDAPTIERLAREHLGVMTA